MGEKKIFTRNVSVVGFTQNQRIRFLESIKEPLEKDGWALQSVKKDKYIDEATFTKDSPSGLVDDFIWGFKRRKPFLIFWIPLVVIALILLILLPIVGAPMLLLLAYLPFQYFWNRSSTKRKYKTTAILSALMLLIVFMGVRYEDAEKAKRAQIELAEKEEHLKYLANAMSIVVDLREELKDVVLVKDIDVDTSGVILLTVSNAWFSLSKGEQRQYRQIFDIKLKQLSPPSGWNFAVVDMLGNKL